MLHEGAAYVTYVRSTVAHGRLVSVDVCEAEAMPGVVAVLTGADVDLAAIPPPMPFFKEAMVRPWLATDKVRFVGEPVAAIVSETRAQGADAAEVVVVDYDPLPAVIDLETAEQGSPLFEDAGTNLAFDMSAMMGFVLAGDFLDGCDAVVRQRIVNQRLAPCPMEVRAAAAAWGPDGRLTQWASTQAASWRHRPGRGQGADGRDALRRRRQPGHGQSG